jgi:hypothetical protein
VGNKKSSLEYLWGEYLWRLVAIKNVATKVALWRKNMLLWWNFSPQKPFAIVVGPEHADRTLGCVRSRLWAANNSLSKRGSINRRGTAWARSLAHFYQCCEPKQTPPTHLHHWFIIKVRLEVIPSVFAWVIASSGTWGSLWLWISCYSWLLSPPRRLGVAKDHWH